MSALQQPVFPSELASALGIQIKSLSRLIKEGRVPPPDVQLTLKTRYWHRATLEAINLIQSASVSAPTPETPVSC